jgi:hypothetical protein
MPKTKKTSSARMDETVKLENTIVTNPPIVNKVIDEAVVDAVVGTLHESLKF